jgi:alkylation response protein AidB-like acyl-CoA dehydrogenase
MPHPYFTGSGKSYCNTEALNIVRECMTLFGGNGLTREYPIEKLLRDAQAQQIEDGENNLLQMHYGYLVSRLNRETRFGHA